MGGPKNFIRGNITKDLLYRFQVRDDGSNKPIDIINTAYTQTFHSSNSTKEYLVTNNLLKLSMVILIHLFYADDNKISLQERHSFKKEVKGLTNLDTISKKFLISLARKKVNQEYVLEYLKTRRINQPDFLEAFTIVSEIVDQSQSYLEELYRLNQLVTNEVFESN
jgi:hypothetical protein